MVGDGEPGLLLSVHNDDEMEQQCGCKLTVSGNTVNVPFADIWQVGVTAKARILYGDAVWPDGNMVAVQPHVLKYWLG